MINDKGFTLIEVLISMLILAFGLLGLAGLQATSLRNNISAYNRSQATLLAYDMADRMRANVADTSDLADQTTSIYNTMDPTDAAVQNSCKLIAKVCTAAQLAENDLFEWNHSIAGGPAENGPPAMVAQPEALPTGQGTISGVLIGEEASRHMMYTITINWDDNRDGEVDATDPSFQMSFQI